MQLLINITALLYVWLNFQFFACTERNNNSLLPFARSIAGYTEDFEPIPLPQLIGTAEFAVYGKVASVDDSVFTFGINKVLIGKVSNKKIKVKKFIPGKFDGPRIADYEPGQSFLLFLKYDSESKTYTVYGLGGEGEMPVDKMYVYFHGRFVEGLRYDTPVVHGVKRKIQRYDLKKFLNALLYYRQCFNYTCNTVQKKYIVTLACGKNDIEANKKTDFINMYLITNTIISR
jgi:hypothetical protein